MAIHIRDHRGGNWFWLHHAGQEQATWVGQRTIATEIGTTREKVNREIAHLRELRLIEVEEQRDERGRATNTYTLLAPPTPVTQDHRGVTQEHIPRDPPSHPLCATRTAMKMNKNQLTRTMEQGDTVTNTIWDAAREELAATMTQDHYDRWLAPLELVELYDGCALIQVPDAGIAAYLEHRLRERLASALGVHHVDVRVA